MSYVQKNKNKTLFKVSSQWKREKKKTTTRDPVLAHHFLISNSCFAIQKKLWNPSLIAMTLMQMKKNIVFEEFEPT